MGNWVNSSSVEFPQHHVVFLRSKLLSKLMQMEFFRYLQKTKEQVKLKKLPLLLRKDVLVKTKSNVWFKRQRNLQRRTRKSKNVLTSAMLSKVTHTNFVILLTMKRRASLTRSKKTTRKLSKKQSRRFWTGLTRTKKLKLRNMKRSKNLSKVLLIQL